ncbi:MAG: cation:proton antiporter [Candidatus Azotimanducaceae bacterium]|uniref:Cation:proton antiporter n=1 Tax=OM182 bacterium TaxID=2510334 RepID=A0A520S128_9GAMM|nr:sodium:proton antiporter [Gammaproteobacteria bacterium]OUV67900.1 MAG: sodium:proton antiporter [Gammaproteobacteria bacterium TMED133]RZO76177.1 MAG: cation:proton antiporter [OM182 bacterium]
MDPLITSFFLIFAGTAVLATLALYTRQPLIVAYILVGIVLGPSGISLIDDPSLITSIAKIGIIFLLFLLGLDMQPVKLANTLKNTSIVAFASCAIFFLIGYTVSHILGFTGSESIVIGIAMIFSSTIIGIKLLPTTVLHHRHTGELVISLLLLQDLIAILVLLVLTGDIIESEGATKLLRALISLPLIALFAFVFVRYILLKLLTRFESFHEYIFLIAIAWCLGLAELAELASLSLEIGAFIAGVSLATSPIAYYIAENLKPLRDFFLVLFFFSLGASFQLELLSRIAIPALILATCILVAKPIVFRVLLHRVSESESVGWEIGCRLGQISEFSLLIAFIATSKAMISQDASHLIQATAIVTFLVSSYIVVMRYPTPISTSNNLRND